MLSFKILTKIKVNINDILGYLNNGVLNLKNKLKIIKKFQNVKSYW